MPDHDATDHVLGADAVVDLTVAAPPTSSAELRAEVDRMVAEVVAATRRISPMLRDATALLAQVDRMVCDYADAGSAGSVDDRYWSAARSVGHDRLFDALQHLSVLADAYSVVQDRHLAAAEVPVG